VLSTRLGEAPILKTAAQVVPEMDAQVAALGRFSSAYNEGWEKP
jgi:hypothetical protein